MHERGFMKRLDRHGYASDRIRELELHIARFKVLQPRTARRRVIRGQRNERSESPTAALEPVVRNIFRPAER